MKIHLWLFTLATSTIQVFQHKGTLNNQPAPSKLVGIPLILYIYMELTTQSKTSTASAKRMCLIELLVSFFKLIITKINWFNTALPLAYKTSHISPQQQSILYLLKVMHHHQHIGSHDFLLHQNQSVIFLTCKSI